MLLQRGRIAHSSIEGVPIIQDDDLDSTDLGKCVRSLQEKEQKDGAEVSLCPVRIYMLGTNVQN